MMRLRTQATVISLLIVNHIASFIVTAALFVWFEYVYPQQGEAPALWFIVLPLRTFIFYLTHRFADNRLTPRSHASNGDCVPCRRARCGPAYSLAVALAFQLLFYEPRWLCLPIGVACSMPQAIILEIPLGFAFLLTIDWARRLEAVRPSHYQNYVELTRNSTAGFWIGSRLIVPRATLPFRYWVSSLLYCLLLPGTTEYGRFLWNVLDHHPTAQASYCCSVWSKSRLKSFQKCSRMFATG